MGLATAKLWENKHNEIRSQRTMKSKLWLVSSDVTGTFGNRAGYGPTAVITPDGSVINQVPRQTVGMLFHEFETKVALTEIQQSHERSSFRSPLLR